MGSLLQPCPSCMDTARMHESGHCQTISALNRPPCIHAAACLMDGHHVKHNIAAGSLQPLLDVLAVLHGSISARPSSNALLRGTSLRNARMAKAARPVPVAVSALAPEACVAAGLLQAVAEDQVAAVIPGASLEHLDGQTFRNGCPKGGHISRLLRGSPCQGIPDMWYSVACPRATSEASQTAPP
jgi:hypothetical protein